MLKIDEGYMYGGVIQLHKKTLKDIKDFYEVAMLQKYIFENYKVTEEQALDLAEKVYELLQEQMMPDIENNIMVEEAIWEIKEELGIELEEQELELE